MELPIVCSLIDRLPHTRDFSHELGNQQVSIYGNVYVVAGLATPAQYYLNCWKPLKLFKLQRDASNGVFVNVAKAEKIE